MLSQLNYYANQVSLLKKYMTVCYKSYIVDEHQSDITPSTTRRYASRYAYNVPFLRVNNNYFMNTFFPPTITEWNKLDLSISTSANLNMFKGRLLQIVKSLENSVYTYHNSKGTEELTRLRLRFSHLCFHKFKHGFPDAVDPLCRCSIAIGNTVHYFLHCPNFSTARNTFLNEITIVDR